MTIHTAEYRAASRIFDQISRLCPIQFNENELQLAFIIMTKTSAININNVIDLRIVDSALIQFVNEIIKQVKPFTILIYMTRILLIFSLSISPMHYFDAGTMFPSDSLSDEIFIQNPLIYEIAVLLHKKLKLLLVMS